MIDVLPRSHSAIFATPEPRRLKPSFYWALAFAVLLHVASILYLIGQSINLPVAVAPEYPGVVITMPALPKPETPVKPVNPPKSVPVHIPPVVTTVDPNNTLKVLPSKSTTGTDDTKTLPTTLGGTAGTADKGTAVTGPVYVNAHWTSFPGADALSKYYPPRALDDEKEGSATVECTVLNTAGQVSCTTVSETPRGYNFGSATVKMVEATGRVDTTQGDVKVGSLLRQTVKWTLQ